MAPDFVVFVFARRPVHPARIHPAPAGARLVEQPGLGIWFKSNARVGNEWLDIPASPDFPIPIP
jgi:hypothetical protein